MFALYTITFFLVKAMPGDAFTGEKNIPEDIKYQMREQSGLNNSLFIQYLNYPKNILLHGDFNYSIKKRRPVSEHAHSRRAQVAGQIDEFEDFLRRATLRIDPRQHPPPVGMVQVLLRDEREVLGLIDVEHRECRVQDSL